MAQYGSCWMFNKSYRSTVYKIVARLEWKLKGACMMCSAFTVDYLLGRLLRQSFLFWFLILNLQNKFTVLGHCIQNLSSRISIHTNRNLQNVGISQILYDLDEPLFVVFFLKTKQRRPIYVLWKDSKQAESSSE
jgi:hypothetical protein